METGLPVGLIPLKRIYRADVPTWFMLPPRGRRREARVFVVPEVHTQETEAFRTKSEKIVVVVKLKCGSKQWLALAEWCMGDIWAVTKMSNEVKAKDLRAIRQADEDAGTELQGCLVSFESILEKCKIEIGAGEDNKLDTELNMDPPVVTVIEKVDNKELEKKETDLDSQLASLVSVSPNKLPTDLESLLTLKYNEILYKTQTSISYFAKSTLARAKAMAKQSHLPKDKTVQEKVSWVEYLIPILKAMVVDIRDLDAKYDHETCWRLVTGHEVWGFGLDEQRYMKSWYDDLNVTSIGLSSASPEFRNGLEHLKTREIQIQILLLLEIISLEKYRESKMGITAPEVKESIAKPKRKAGLVRLKKRPGKISIQPSKSPEFLSAPSTTTIAVAMFDRLCIRNLSSADSSDIAFNKSQYKSVAQATAASDKTQEFCRECIMPFYNSKLPELCKTLVASCRGNSIGLTRTKSKTSASRQSSTSTVISRDDTPAPVPAKVTKSSSLRGGFTTSFQFQKEDRRQFSMSLQNSFNHISASNSSELQSTLNAAIREIARPSRKLVSSQHANSLPSTRFTTQRSNDPNFGVEVECTPVKRKRPRKLRPPSKVPSLKPTGLVILDGHVYSDGEDSHDDHSFNDEIVMETPMKRRLGNSEHFTSNALVISQDDENFQDNSYDVINSSPIKATPIRNFSIQSAKRLDSSARKSQQWFDSEFPSTQSHADLI